MNKRILALLAALALAAALLTACGGNDAPPPEPTPVEDGEQTPPPGNAPGPQPAAPETNPMETDIPDEPDENGQDTDAGQPEADAPETSPPPETALEPPPETEPEPAPVLAPEPETESVMAGDTYTISVALAGGSGRATVESPAKLRYEGGKYWATIVWSSPNFDYMKVDGQRYDLINDGGNSTFEIPVAAFDTPLAVIADTIAMSEPHEVEYTLTFDSASIQDA